MNGAISKRYSVAMRALLAVLVAMALKLIAHWFGWEFVSLNPLFSGIVAANVFLMSFLLSGVLTDCKESERLPGELAASLEAIADEASAICRTKKAQAAVARASERVARAGYAGGAATKAAEAGGAGPLPVG
jgi:hypothetical protein